VLEKLYKEKWSQRDGLGALIISPTRELALQTFKVLKVIGRHHDFSADIVIGGKVLAACFAHSNVFVLSHHLKSSFPFVTVLCLAILSHKALLLPRTHHLQLFFY